MKYDLIIEKQLERMTSLKRVRIKVDPKYVAAAENLGLCDSYEGYVLEEGLTHLKILVLPPEFTIAEIPNDLIEYIADEHVADVFEQLVVHFIKSLNLSEGDPLIHQLLNCNNVDEIELLAREHGLNDEKIAEIYKEFIQA